MKRFSTTTLTLALITGLFAGKASAQDALSLIQTAEGTMSETDGILHRFAAITTTGTTGSDFELVNQDNGHLTIDTQAGQGVIDPADCQSIVDKDTAHIPPDSIIHPDDCPEIMDLFFELVDAGFTDDEAFDLIEMVMGEG